MYSTCTAYILGVFYALLTSEQVVGEGSGGRLNVLSENFEEQR